MALTPEQEAFVANLYGNRAKIADIIRDSGRCVNVAKNELVRCIVMKKIIERFVNPGVTTATPLYKKCMSIMRRLHHYHRAGGAFAAFDMNDLDAILQGTPTALTVAEVVAAVEANDDPTPEAGFDYGSVAWPD